MATQNLKHATSSSTLADVLERILDKGVVIAGDIKIKLVDIELLTIQIRLLICSVDKAKEIGVDWWVGHPAFSRHQQERLSEPDTMAKFSERLARLEAAAPPDGPKAT